MTVHTSAVSPSATGAAASPPAAAAATRRRLSNRRLRPEGEGQSSREASAESNDETSSPSLLEDDDDDDDDNVSLSAPTRSRPTATAPPVGYTSSSTSTSTPSATAAGVGHRFDELNLGDVTLQQGGTGIGGGQRQQQQQGGEGALTEGYDSAHDGDVSSATTAASSSVSAARLATHPHAFRAPVSLHPSALSHPHPNPHNLSQMQQQSSASGEEGLYEEEEEEDGGYSPSPPSQTETETDGEPLHHHSHHPKTTAGTIRSSSSKKAAAAAAAVPSSYPERRPAQSEPVMWAPAPSGFLSSMTAQDIQEHIRRAIAGDPGRPYKIKPPPTGRPVRIYADGVYDLLHYGHMLQLRQCKLMFPSVHLLVGVCSSALVEQHKSHPVFSSEERYESMRHIRWVDEVVEDAPWQVDQEFIDKWQIDYVAHDEEPYASAGKEDVYAYAKSIGSFLPTKRTNGISTSELLQRIVEGYREGEYDSKLRKIGHPELCSQPASVKAASVKAE
ncbi:hypothetical protein B0A53_02582 [Rhodotorula sp. CCFEE 5036]|nr:hypothetical protein B0A53_02582 [Rhodotorula sp. CCFEE 5036]